MPVEHKDIMDNTLVAGDMVAFWTRYGIALGRIMDLVIDSSGLPRLRLYTANYRETHDSREIIEKRTHSLEIPHRRAIKISLDSLPEKIQKLFS